jgi:glyoxylase I family protein
MSCPVDDTSAEPSLDDVRYAHTNLIAADWRRLAQFYIDTFDCQPVGPQRGLSGEWLNRATGVEDAQLEGQHLLLPGHGQSGPTLEIFTYRPVVEQTTPVANRAGYGHIAFEIDDVPATLAKVIEHGGQELGQIATTSVEGVGTLEITYARDPEGNIVELQSWTTPG